MNTKPRLSHFGLILFLSITLWPVPSFAVQTANQTSPSEQNKQDTQLIDMEEMLDASTLDVKVLQPWHEVHGKVTTRQKLVSIRVGDLIPNREYRVPVRFIVPKDRPARGFHLTGGNQLDRIKKDKRLDPTETELIAGGVGLVQTMVQTLKQSEQGELGHAADQKFIETLNPRYSIQYWGWPATLMRAVTAAHAEKEYFVPGKVALSGGSKNGASPSTAIIHDKRMTAVFASVSPIWDSPLRLCDEKAWKELDAKQPGRGHAFLGGTYGPVYNKEALANGHSWDDLKALANRMADHVFISRNIKSLRERNVDLLFRPGTHDFVAFDLAWGGKHHPDIPVYLEANTGHGVRGRHSKNPRDRNMTAWLFEHFFDDVVPLLAPPTVETEIVAQGKGQTLVVMVSFEPRESAEDGRIWWMLDRGPDGSPEYLKDLFPEDNWADMKFDKKAEAWVAEIEIEAAADVKHIDFFTSHRKTIHYKHRPYPSYLSSPYTRVKLK